MLRSFSKRRNQKGFTLIEILIVVVIVAILAAISVPIYIEYVKSARASDAKTAINAIYQAAQVFYQDTGDWPQSIEDLETQKYLDLQQSTKLQWSFNIVGAPPTEIIGTSTEQMRGGAGHQVRYEVQTGTWNGYGLPEEEGGN